VFRYIFKTIHPSGATERLVQEFPFAEVVLGRGGESHIILPGQRVAAMHARLVWDGTSLTVLDLGSLAGVRLNSKRVSSAIVQGGDTITLGDVQIHVTYEAGCVVLDTALVRDSMPLEKAPFVAGIEQLRVESYLPKMRRIVVAVATLSLVAFAVYPLLAKDFSPWNSGPISNVHGLIAQDCQKCHAEPFVRVQDRECLYCHEMSDHAPRHATFVAKHSDLAMRCAACHMEHNGDHGLIRSEPEFCIGCHAEIRALSSDTAIDDVPHLSRHPQFRVRVADPRGGFQRVRIDDSAAVDRSAIKLNHQVHLQEGIRGAQGPVTLSCSSCHEPDKEYKGLAPISFERHCKDCHSLGFDERLPEAQVPHGDAQGVFPALLAEYAKLAVQGVRNTDLHSAETDGRMIPLDGASPRAQSVLPVSDIVGNAREAERQLFTRTGCFLCHEYQEKDAQERTETSSWYQIVDPSIPQVWMPGARFDHGAHQEFSCESCHEGARKSLKTADILLPRIQGCQKCHSQDATPGYVKSGCATCHSYHQTIGFPGEKKQTIADYLNTLTR
jgi:hypothetical protein